MKRTTKQEHDANESRNIRVVHDFMKHWGDIGMNLRVKEFKAHVSCTSRIRSIDKITDVKVSLLGYGTVGKVDIAEAENLTVDDYHLQFHPKYGTYELRKSKGELVILGESQKMEGEYIVRIRPIYEL